MGITCVCRRAVGVSQHLDGGRILPLCVEGFPVERGQQRQWFQPRGLVPPPLQSTLQSQLPGGEKRFPFLWQGLHGICVKGSQQQDVRRQRTAGKSLLLGQYQLLIAKEKAGTAGKQGVPAGLQILRLRYPDKAQTTKQKLRHLRRGLCLALLDLG